MASVPERKQGPNGALLDPPRFLLNEPWKGTSHGRFFMDSSNFFDFRFFYLILRFFFHLFRGLSEGLSSEYHIGRGH